MSLRARLTLLYTGLAGGILLLFGLAVYGLVNVTLVDQLDQILTENSKQIIASCRVDANGSLVVDRLPAVDLASELYIQIWGLDNRLRASSPNIPRFSTPLDADSLSRSTPIYRDVLLNKASLRVVTTPLVVNGHRVGVLQVAASRAMIDSGLNVLVTVLGGMALISMLIAGIAAWLTTGQALAPLETVTETALSITRADDLSRRIPAVGNRHDEVGELVDAFNQTLARLEQLFSSQQRFMADVSHELRTPLTVIKGNVGLIRKFGEADEESLSSIEMEVDRLTRMVGDLLLLAQADSGKLPLALQTVPLDTLVLEVLHQMRVLAKDRVKMEIKAIDQITITADPDRLKQVFLNILGNAIKYTPAGGEITLSLNRVGFNAQCIIADNGPGIPAQDLPHVFERFYRGEKSRTRGADSNSFGLGLSIAYWIVKSHGGWIDVSSYEGQGTTFCIWLPLGNPAGLETTAADPDSLDDHS